MAKKDLHTEASQASKTQASSKDAPVSTNTMQASAKNVKDTSPKVTTSGKPQNPNDVTIPPAIDKWADLIYNNLDNAVKVGQTAPKVGTPPTQDLTPTVTMSRFGVKPHNIREFLVSPAGKGLMTNIGMKMAAEKSLEDYRQLELRERELMMHRIRSAFFLWALEKKAHAHDKQEEIVLAQNAKAIKNSGQTPTPTASSTTNTTQKLGLMQAIDDYQKALEKNQEERTKLANERNELDTQLNKLHAEGELIDFKYNLFEAQLADFDDFLSKCSKLDSQLSDKEIEQHIEQVRQKMEEYLVHVDDLIMNNQDEEASILMKMHTALGLQLATHHDMLAVRDQKKYYVREDGSEAKSFEEAHFVLNTNLHTEDEALKSIAPELRRERIHKEGNKYYLLKPGQTWDSIKDNDEARNEAHKRFEHKKPELMVVKNLVRHNKGLETDVHQERVQDVKDKIQTNENQSQLNNNQKNVIESSLAQSRAALQQLNNDIKAQNATTPTPVPKPVPTPTVTAGPSSPKPQPKASVAQTYKEKLELFKKMPQLEMTGEQLLTLAGQAPGDQAGPARKYVKEQLAQQNIPRSAPIPYQTMQSLLKNLERFGVSASKPSVTPIQSPRELQEEARRGPNPFSTNPFKIPGGS